MTEIEIIKKFSFDIRKNILDMSLNAAASSSHLGGGLSIVEIISVIYCKFLNLTKDPKDPNRNRFVLSKGHGVLPYYAALYLKGYLQKEDLQLFEKTNGRLFGHPIMNRDLGVEFSTGSLGMGISIAVGLSLSFKKRKKDNKVFVLIGDGECNEGSVWEAAMSSVHHNLDNLTIIVDHNGFQQTGSNDEINKVISLKNKWQSFGLEVIELDGHKITDLINAFEKKFEKPKLILANTVKGKGFSFSENNNDWHHKILTKTNYDQAIKELNSNYGI